MKCKSLISLELFVKHQNNRNLPVLFSIKKYWVSLYAKLMLANTERGYSLFRFLHIMVFKHYKDICALTSEVKTDFVQMHLLKNRFNHKSST